jgi:hypothetical protein
MISPNDNWDVILARFCQNVQTFLQETMLKHIFIEVFKEYDEGI